MKKRGFTLIELLAVIIILAIIALIATPIIMRVVENSKKGASKASIQNYLHAIETQAVAYRIDGEMVSNGTYSINSDGDVCLDSSCTNKLQIQMKGSKPSSGGITIENGKVVSAMSLYINPKYYIYADDEIQEFEIGGYDSNNQLVADWDTLVKEGYITLSNDKKTITGSNKDKMASIAMIVIPEKITSLGNYAFYNCDNLISIIIPESVTSIGGQSFQYCKKLKSIILPQKITTIPQGTFYGCSNLESVTLPSSLISMGVQAFSGCTSLSSINIPEGLTSIGDSAFYNCSKLTDVTLPSTLTNIGDWAFRGTLLTAVNIPASVTNIGGGAFGDCKRLSSITVDGGNSTYEDGNSNAIIQKSTHVLISGCSNTNIPEWVTGIGEFAFYDSVNLTSIKIPEGVTSIGQLAFDGCYSLSGIVIPSSVNTIEGYAFRNSIGPITFKNPNGWSAGNTVISSSDLSNGNTAAQYLRSTYVSSTWTRSE